MSLPVLSTGDPLIAVEVGYQSRVVQLCGWNPLHALEVNREYRVVLEAGDARVVIEGGAPWVHSLAQELMQRRGDKLSITVGVAP